MAEVCCILAEATNTIAGFDEDTAGAEPEQTGKTESNGAFDSGIGTDGAKD